MNKRFFKKGLLVLSMMAMSLSLLLANGSAEAPKTGKKEINLEISIATKSAQWWAVYADMLRSAVDAANAEGTYSIKANIVHNDNPASQVLTINDQIINRPDVVIMAPVDMATSVSAVDACFQAGIPVITCCRTSNSKNVTAARLYNEALFGANQVDKIHEEFPNGANIVYLFGPNEASYAIEQYQTGFLAQLKKYPNLKVLQVLADKQDTQDVGLKLADDALLKFDNIDAFAATNDGLALGAVQAVKASGRSKIKVFGSSALPQGMVAIRDGFMQFTNLKSQAVMADAMIKLAIQVYEKQQVESFGYIDPVVVTTENVLTVKDATFGGTIADPATFNFDKYSSTK
jgi:ABC-type sugar transport system substrate-binding protein